MSWDMSTVCTEAQLESSQLWSNFIATDVEEISLFSVSGKSVRHSFKLKSTSRCTAEYYSLNSGTSFLSHSWSEASTIWKFLLEAGVLMVVMCCRGNSETLSKLVRPATCRVGSECKTHIHRKETQSWSGVVWRAGSWRSQCHSRHLWYESTHSYISFQNLLWSVNLMANHREDVCTEGSVLRMWLMFTYGNALVFSQEHTWSSADYLQEHAAGSILYGFQGGPAGIMKCKYVEITADFLYPYRNQVNWFPPSEYGKRRSFCDTCWQIVDVASNIEGQGPY